jgi:hypothetical protein
MHALDQKGVQRMTEKPRPPKLSAADKAFRRQAACAVLSGLYASHGIAIMDAEKPERDLAIRSAARVALQQADAVLRREMQA